MEEVKRYNRKYSKSKKLIRSKDDTILDSHGIYSSNCYGLHDFETPHDIARGFYIRHFYDRPEYEIPDEIKKAIDNIKNED